MNRRGFVYAGTLSERDLKGLLERLKVRVHFAWSLAKLEPGEGPPVDLRDNGTAFSDRCEVRWQRLDEDEFRVLVLSDEDYGDLPLSAVEGRWTTETQETRLWNLEEPAINPSFERYPVVNAKKAKLHCRVFYRDGVVLFISPREVLSDDR